MKISAKSLWKYSLNKWFIFIISLAVGFSVVLCEYVVTSQKTVCQVSTQLLITQDFEEGHLGSSDYSPNLYKEKVEILMNNTIAVLNDKNFLTSQYETVQLDFDENVDSITIEAKSSSILSIVINLSNKEQAEKLCNGIVDSAWIQINSCILDNLNSANDGFKEGLADKDKIIVRQVSSPVVNDETEEYNNLNFLIYPLAAFIGAIFIVIACYMCSNKIVSVNELRARYSSAFKIIKHENYENGLEVLLNEEFMENGKNETFLILSNGSEKETANVCAKKIPEGLKVLLIDTTGKDFHEKTKISKNSDCIACSVENIAELVTMVKKALQDSKDIYDAVLILSNYNTGFAYSVLAKIANKVFLNVNLNKDTYSSLNEVVYQLNMENSKIDSVFVN